jgi:hypothetical protein
MSSARGLTTGDAGKRAAKKGRIIISTGGSEETCEKNYTMKQINEKS